MVFNRENDGPIQTENDENKDDGAISTRLADERIENPNSNSTKSNTAMFFTNKVKYHRCSSSLPVLLRLDNIDLGSLW